MPSSFTVQEAASLEREQSPEAPPYSPITPTEGSFPLSDGALNRSVDFMHTQPPSEPMNESTNPDAIALRATLGILQLQRQRALQDMQILERQKDQALDDPEGFSNAVTQGTVRSRNAPGVGSAKETDEDISSSDEEDDKKDQSEDTKEKFSNFGEIPTAQNVARYPPINWSKYHVVGDALDNLHKEQQTRPDSGQEPSDRPPVHDITAPYNPWKDRLPEKTSHSRSDATRKGPT